MPKNTQQAPLLTTTPFGIPALVAIPFYIAARIERQVQKETPDHPEYLRYTLTRQAIAEIWDPFVVVLARSPDEAERMIKSAEAKYHSLLPELPEAEARETLLQVIASELNRLVRDNGAERQIAEAPPPTGISSQRGAWQKEVAGAPSTLAYTFIPANTAFVTAESPGLQSFKATLTWDQALKRTTEYLAGVEQTLANLQATVELLIFRCMIYRHMLDIHATLGYMLPYDQAHPPPQWPSPEAGEVNEWPQPIGKIRTWFKALHEALGEGDYEDVSDVMKAAARKLYKTKPNTLEGWVRTLMSKLEIKQYKSRTGRTGAWRVRLLRALVKAWHDTENRSDRDNYGAYRSAMTAAAKAVEDAG